jgi:tRNA threonylcarbamoyladenosine modification (KEOPS) complex  Pcc1 subunit
MPSTELANLTSKALQPETAVSQASGSSVQIRTKDDLLSLEFYAQSTATSRALINSYLRWITMIREAISLVN